MQYIKNWTFYFLQIPFFFFLFSKGAKIGPPHDFPLASQFTPLFPNKGTLLLSPAGTDSEVYFKPLLFSYGQLADSTCLQEVSKYQMPPRPHDILSPASNASNVRPPAILPSEVDHVTWKSISSQAIDLYWSKTPHQVQWKVPGIQQIHKLRHCVSVLTSVSSHGTLLRPSLMTYEPQRDASPVGSNKCCTEKPIGVQLRNIPTDSGRQWWPPSHKASTPSLRQTQVSSMDRDDPAHESFTLGNKWCFQRLNFGPFAVSLLWHKWPPTNAIHLLVACGAREPGHRQELCKWKVDR